MGEGKKDMEFSSCNYGTVKSVGALQGPVPMLFQVSIHHLAAPEANTVVGVTEQVPVPAGHPAAAAVYHVAILFPVESFTQR
jgi:hypothetical protein